MKGSSETDFDPALRAALRRAWSADPTHSAAPAYLQHQIADLMARTPATVSRSWWQKSATWSSAAAAACLLVVLWVAVRTGQLGGSSSEAIAAAGVIPTNIQDDLIFRHDWCDANLPEHHRLDGVPRDDMDRIARAMGSSLNQRVWVADLGKEGWRFRGAKVCRVGDSESAKPSAHLMFDKSDDVASVFSISLPANDDRSADNAQRPGQQRECCFTLKGHIVSGFVQQGQLYCIIVRSPQNTTTPADVRGLRDRHRAEIVAMADEARRLMVVSSRSGLPPGR